MVLMFQQRHRHRILFIIGFLIGVPSITTFIRLLFNPLSSYKDDNYIATHFPRISTIKSERRFISSSVGLLIHESFLDISLSIKF